MKKTHLKIAGVDARHLGQSDFEFSHQTACGYVRDKVTTSAGGVNCFYCLRSEEMKRHEGNGIDINELEGSNGVA